MNRCDICDISDDEYPKADIRTVQYINNTQEDLCEQCRKSIEEVNEEYAIADLEEDERQEQSYWNEVAVSEPKVRVK